MKKLQKISRHYLKRLAEDPERHDTIPAPPPSGVERELDFELDPDSDPEPNLEPGKNYNTKSIKAALDKLVTTCIEFGAKAEKFEEDDDYSESLREEALEARMESEYAYDEFLQLLRAQGVDV